MEHAIRHEINVRVEENPAFYQSLRQRLEEIIEQRRLERLDDAQQLSLLNSLREELKGEQTQAQDIGLDGRGFAIYGLLQQHRASPLAEKAATYDVANRDLASLIDEAVEPFTDLGGLGTEGGRAAPDAQQDQAAAPRRRDRPQGDGLPRRRDRGPGQGADRAMTGSLETSAITWGGTRLTYAIRRSARRKKTVAVTVDPGGGVLLLAPEDFPTSRLDEVARRKAAWIVRRMRGVGANGVPPSPREFVSGESVMYLGRHYRLKVLPWGDGRGEAARGVAACAGAGGGGGGAADHVRAALVSWLRSHAGREAAGAGGDVAAESRGGDAPGGDLRPEEALGQLRPQRDHPAELADHPGPDAAGGLRGGPRAGAPAAPGPRAGVLAGPRADHAGL